MSRKECNQLEVFGSLKQKTITQRQASKMLNLSVRWIRKKMKRFAKQGATGLIHASRGRPSKRKWDLDQRKQVLDLYIEKYPDFGPTFALEKIKQKIDLSISVETFRKALIQESLRVCKKRRQRHRKRRERREHRGELIQIDGSKHNWFEGRAPGCTLLVAIDDATSALQHLLFVSSESTNAYLTFIKQYIQKNKRPVAFYSDRHSALKVNTNNQDGYSKTQVERVLRDLDIGIIHAHSPQAKGRVERVNATLQDRLVKELRLCNISTPEQANEFVKSTYIGLHNAKFSCKPAKPIDMHRSPNRYDLDVLFCTVEQRVVQNDFTVRYKNKIFQLLKEQIAHVRPKEQVLVHEYPDGSIRLSLRSYQLNFSVLGIKHRKPKNAIEHVERQRLTEHGIDYPLSEVQVCSSAGGGPM